MGDHRFLPPPPPPPPQLPLPRNPPPIWPSPHTTTPRTNGLRATDNGRPSPLTTDQTASGPHTRAGFRATVGLWVAYTTYDAVEGGILGGFHAEGPFHLIFLKMVSRVNFFENFRKFS